MYRLELHSHCAPISTCASASPAQVIARYKEAGYQGLVSTNHINRSTFHAMEEKSWAEKVDYFLQGYEGLKAAAGAGFDVLLGCEFGLQGFWNDYLVFGVTKEWLLALGDPRDRDIRAIAAQVRADGLLIYQAHPFRYGMTMVGEDVLDGIEVYNAHQGHDSRNFLADCWAKERRLPAISGSDFHDPSSHIGGGIMTDVRIADNETLLSVLRRGDYQLLRQ